MHLSEEVTACCLLMQAVSEAKEVKERYPFLDMDNPRFPIKAALAQPRGGTVRHDAVAWGYARGASDLGVDIIQNCEVTGFNIENVNV